MTQFVVRVELTNQPDHSHADYGQLRRTMEYHHFRRFVVGLDGSDYHLPTATYAGHFDYETAIDVTTQVKLILDPIFPEYIVFTVKVDHAAGILDAISPPLKRVGPIDVTIV